MSDLNKPRFLTLPLDYFKSKGRVPRWRRRFAWWAFGGSLAWIVVSGLTTKEMHLGASPGQEVVHPVVEQSEAHGMPGGEHHPLAVGGRPSQPVSGRLAGVEDRARRDLDRSVPCLRIDRGAGLPRDQLEDVVEVERAGEPGEAEQLVGIGVDQHQRVGSDVVQGMGGRAGHSPGQQRSLEVAAVVRSDRPALVERRKPSHVSFDDAHVGERVARVLGNGSPRTLSAWT